MSAPADSFAQRPSKVNYASSSVGASRSSNPSPQYMENVMSRFGHHLSPNEIRSISFTMTSVKSSNGGGVTPMLAKGVPSRERSSFHYHNGPPSYGGAIINVAK